MMAKQLQAYQNNSVTTASGPQLTLMLYNGCMKFIKQGRKALLAEDFQLKNESIQKAQNIIQELMITLDPNLPISADILPLYEYIHHQLLQGNLTNDVALLDEALAYVLEFRDVWKEAMKEDVKVRPSGGIV